MSQEKDSIVKSTKEGALYIVVSDLFAKDNVQALLKKLEGSSIKKRIDARREKKEAIPQ